MRVRFGEFTLDSDTRQLFGGAGELRLSRKAFDLLAILLDRRPAVVDKDALREKLWGGTSVVDANLNNLASEIRAVLADDPQQPRFLRTVHRVGYAFCGDASEIGPQSTAHGPQAALHSLPPRFWVLWKDRTIVLDSDTTLVGRDPDSAIWIDVPGVSRRHAAIRIVTDGTTTGAVIEDLGSTNGTFVDGRRVTKPVPLGDGDTIRVGEATLTFRAWSAANAPTKRIAHGSRKKLERS